MFENAQDQFLNEVRLKEVKLKSFEFQIDNQESEHKTFHISKFLHRYNSRTNIYHLQKIQCLISDKPNKNAQISIPYWKSLRVNIKDIAYENQKDHIKRIYQYDQSINNIQKFGLYYRFYAQIPNIFNKEHFKVLARYVDQKNKLNYEKLQKFLAVTDSQLNSEINTIDQLLKQPQSYDKILLDLQSQRNTHKTTQSQSFYILKNALQQKYGVSNEKHMKTIDKSYEFKKSHQKQNKTKDTLKLALQQQLQSIDALNRDQILYQSNFKEDHTMRKKQKDKHQRKIQKMVIYQKDLQLNQNKENKLQNKTGNKSNSFYFLPKIKINIKLTQINEAAAIRKSGHAEKEELKVQNCVKYRAVKDYRQQSKSCQNNVHKDNQNQIKYLQKIHKEVETLSKDLRKKDIVKAIQSIKRNQLPYCMEKSKKPNKNQRIKTSVEQQQKQNQKRLKKCSINKFPYNQKLPFNKQIRHTLNSKRQ